MEEIALNPMPLTESILELGKGGVLTLIVMLLFIICGLIYVFYKITSNHINHNTEALTKVDGSNHELSKSVDTLGQILERKL